VNIKGARRKLNRKTPEEVIIMRMVLNNIDPETRGKLYELQAEKGLPNLSETVMLLVKIYYNEKNEV